MRRVAIDADHIKRVSCLGIVEFGDRQGIAGYVLELAGITTGKNRDPSCIGIQLDLFVVRQGLRKVCPFVGVTFLVTVRRK